MIRALKGLFKNRFVKWGDQTLSAALLSINSSFWTPNPHFFLSKLFLRTLSEKIIQ
ncbi:hypothetical protein C943_00862 [Mariniradius saccharolyticus AK6]|uniref:Uncharacterized protein n=1 Tax=Mariniradius saccharolyticus AK6 TaxID=1239962 RepID=M7Y6K8_9BACT|nr:hypothetical protein C943_00862 [Mariniradius saccharolyticus AK6]